MLIGLVGKPNAGKSTFFKACTLAEVEIANYPFTTIKANEGIGFVRVKCPEKELKELKEKQKKCNPQHGFCMNGERFVPVRLVDVAGLVPEAHKGKGRGNEFLNDLMEADLLIQVLDASGRTDAQGNPTQNYDVEEEIEFLRNEVDMWIYGLLENKWKSISRKSHTTKLSEVLSEQLSGLKIKTDTVKEVMKLLELSEKADGWTEAHILEFAREIRKRSKPIIIAANKADRSEASENIKRLKEKYSETLIVPCSAESELALREAGKDKLIDYIPGNKEFKITGNLSEQQKHALNIINKDVLGIYNSTGIQQCLNEAVFKFLKYIVVFPVENEHHFTSKKGNILPDAHLLPQHSTSLDLAFSIHSDIGKNFLAAVDCRTGKKLGKDSELRDSDVVKIMAKT
jgi:ribosome-binding ATPase YchF (GTP1/OBG family)